jgi:hypothetical protein
MIRISSASPIATDLLALSVKQAVIDAHATHANQVAEAQKLWSTKNPVLFARVRGALSHGSPSPVFCHYCEQSEEAAIEHIYPKAHFPERTFQWPNYLLACTRCNSTYKGEKWTIFEPTSGSAMTELDLATTPRPIVGSISLFIDPRCENPLDYIELNLASGYFNAVSGMSPMDERRAEFTFDDALKLNRGKLPRCRKNQYTVYLQKLRDYVALRATAVAASPSATMIPTSDMNAIKADILDDPHPTVWAEMKRQHTLILELGALFTAAPEALSW